MPLPSNRLDARRDALQPLANRPASVHAGLWLERWLPYQHDPDADNPGPNQPDARAIRAEHIRALEDLPIPDGYKEAFARWEESFRLEPGQHRRRRGTGTLQGTVALAARVEVEGRMVVGLGAKGPLEAGLRLDRTWGVPLIPGSVLKGVAAAAAHRLTDDDRWRRGSWWPEQVPSPEDSARAESYLHAFGSVLHRGELTFQDARLIPDSVRSNPIHLDVMTVHHARYYQDPTDTAPPASDTDSPIPVAFASVSGSYLIVIEGEEAWATAAMEILELGLAHIGIGAKTSSGYGRLRFSGRLVIDAPSPPLDEEAKNRLAVLKQEVAGRKFNASVVAERGPAMLDSLKGFPELQKALVELIVEKLGAAWFDGKVADNKPWALRFRDIIVAHAPATE